MAAKAESNPAEADTAPKRGKGKLLLLGAPVLLLAVLAGLWFGGILPPLLGMGPAPAAQEAQPATPPPPQPGFVDLPEIVSNLNVPGRRTSFVRLRARLEISDGAQAAAVQAAMPRLMDLFATYLREVRPEELRGSAGTHRLREELIARATLAIAAEPRPGQPPLSVTDLLFTEILVQ
jgi:flagellar FliL protein